MKHYVHVCFDNIKVVSPLKEGFGPLIDDHVGHVGHAVNIVDNEHLNGGLAIVKCLEF